MSLSAFLATSVALVGDLDNETLATSESCRSSRTKTSEHPLEGVEATADASSIAGVRVRVNKSRRDGRKVANVDTESQLVALKYELAQAKANADRNRHLADKLKTENERLRKEIKESRVEQEQTVQQVRHLENQVEHLKAENNQISGKASQLVSRLGEADTVADAFQLSQNDPDMEALVVTMAHLAEEECKAKMRQVVKERDHLRLYAKKIFADKKKVQKERDALRGRLTGMMSVEVVDSQPPERSLRGMLTSMTSNRSVLSTKSMPVESFIWSDSGRNLDKAVTSTNYGI